MKRKLVAAALVGAVCIGVVVTRAVYDGRQALHRGAQALEAGDRDEAIAQYRRAARWYVPGAPHVARAYDELEAIAVAAERAGELDTALAAWRGIRSSILATRSFYTPFSERLDPANRAIARLMARVEGDAADPDATAEQREAFHYELLARDLAPSVGWGLVALLGFALWIGGGVVFAARGVTADDRLAARPAATAGLMVAIGLVIWMLGLYNA